SRDLPVSQLRRGWWPAELRNERGGLLPSGRRLRWKNSQGRETGRAAGPAVHHSRVGHKPQNGQGTRHHHSAPAHWPRRRGDPVTRRELITLLRGAAVAWPCVGRLM